MRSRFHAALTLAAALFALANTAPGECPQFSEMLPTVFVTDTTISGASDTPANYYY